MGSQVMHASLHTEVPPLCLLVTCWNLLTPLNFGDAITKRMKWQPYTGMAVSMESLCCKKLKQSTS